MAKHIFLHSLFLLAIFVVIANCEPSVEKRQVTSILSNAVSSVATVATAVATATQTTDVAAVASSVSTAVTTDSTATSTTSTGGLLNGVTSVVSALGSELTSVTTDAGSAVTSLGTAVASVATDAGSAVTSVGAGATSALTAVTSDIGAQLASAVSTVTPAAGALLSSVTSGVNGVVSSVGSVATGALTGVTSLTSDTLSVVTDTVGAVTSLATGTISSVTSIAGDALTSVTSLTSATIGGLTLAGLISSTEALATSFLGGAVLVPTEANNALAFKPSEQKQITPVSYVWDDTAGFVLTPGSIQNNNTAPVIAINIGTIREVDQDGNTIVEFSRLNNLTVYERADGILVTGFYPVTSSQLAPFIMEFANVKEGGNVQFAGRNIYLNNHTIKTDIQIMNWPFEDPSHHLEFKLAYSPLVTINKNESYISANGSVVTDLFYNGGRIRESFLFFASVDNISKAIDSHLVQNEDGTISRVMIVPSFNSSVIIDPQINVLLGGGSSSSSKESRTKKRNTGIIIGCVLGGVLVAAILISLFMWRVYKTRRNSSWLFSSHSVNRTTAGSQDEIY